MGESDYLIPLGAKQTHIQLVVNSVKRCNEDVHLINDNEINPIKVKQFISNLVKSGLNGL